MQAMTRIVEKLKYSTWLRLFFDFLAKMGIRITPYFVAQEKPGAGALGGMADGFEAFRFRVLTPGDMAGLSRIPGRSITERHLIQRLEKGHFCFGLMKGGDIVAFSWVNPQEGRSELCSFALRTHEAYFYDLYTVPAWRGNRLALHMRYHAYRYLFRQGLTEFYSVHDALNTPAVKFKQKLQARLIYKGVSLKLFNRYKYNVCIWPSSEFSRRIRS